MYRLLAAPVLIYLIIVGNLELYKWMLPLSFFTDLIDGYLARKYKAISVFGSRLDSIADDLTIVAAIIGVFAFKMDFVKEQKLLVGIMLVLYLAQTISALIRYRKISSFHTYIAKIAAIFQGVFLILLFIGTQAIVPLFYTAAFFTIADLAEEIALVLLLPKWEADVKGLYWVLKR